MQYTKKLLQHTHTHTHHGNAEAYIVFNGEVVSLLPSINEVWDKVMFLHFCHFVHRGMMSLPVWLAIPMFPLEGVSNSGLMFLPGGLWCISEFYNDTGDCQL